MHYLLHSRVFGLHKYARHMESSIQLHTFVFARLHWITLHYFLGYISYQEIFLCVVNYSLKIYLSYSKNWCFFHHPCLEGFPRVYFVSYDWLIYVNDIFVIFTCGLYIYEIHMWMIYSYVTDLWDTYELKFIDKSFKVQSSLIFLKHQDVIRE